MRLRAFTELGVTEARDTLDQMRRGELEGIPESLLSSESLSADLGIEMRSPKKGEFSTRWQLGMWLYQQLQEAAESTLYDSQMWSWLAFYLFDLVCPVRNGHRKVLEDARYILDRGDYRKFYRHLVSGPYFAIKAHEHSPASVKGILATDPSAVGAIYEELASRKAMMTSRGVMQAATKLYLNESTNRVRRGAGGKGPGSARRLAAVLMQYDVTHDLYAMDGDKLVEMLPREFQLFLE